jgi:peroxiredoxin
MKAHPFDLPGVDGKRHSPASARGDKGLVVLFICNHCPYVKKSIDRIVRDCAALKDKGFGSIAVMPNDPNYNPEDSFDNMKRVARDKAFPFPYVIDESQEVARAYDAVCTPDFYGFDANLELRYHGRLEDLVQAMTGTPPARPVNSIGCSIKWKK